jgi:hypothetical protein
MRFYFISEARLETLPIARIEAGCIPQLAVADLCAIDLQLKARFSQSALRLGEA